MQTFGVSDRETAGFSHPKAIVKDGMIKLESSATESEYNAVVQMIKMLPKKKTVEERLVALEAKVL